MMRNAPAIALACAGLAPVAHAQTASQALDSSWVRACAEATPGTAFYERCEEILNAGPGSGTRRSAAAVGNNLEIFASQGRLMMAMAKARARAAARAHAKANEGEGDNFAAADADAEAQTEVLAQGAHWALLGSASFADVERSDTGFERGYDDSASTFLLGFDYRWNAHWTGLLTAQREKRDIDFQNGSGGMDADTDMLSAALAYNGDRGFFASLALSAGRTDTRLRREIEYTLVLNAGQPNESTKTIRSRGQSDNGSSMRGAQFDLGWERASGAWTFRYGGDASWQQTQVERIAENNDVGLDFLIFRQEVTSLQAGAGVEVARTVSSARGVWQPYARLRWRHEFADDPRRVFGAFRGGLNVFRLSFVTGEPDRNFGEFGLGVVGVFTHGWQAYAGWQRSFGNSRFEENRFDFGWRKEF
jgi:outer membrane autotransporter protein